MGVLLFLAVFLAVNLVLLKWAKSFKYSSYIPNAINGRPLVGNYQLEEMREQLLKRFSKF